MAKRIMLVDDSATIRQAAGFVLRDAGYEVIEAGDGVEALRTMEQKTVDMLITDLNMPRLDGIDLITNLRRGGHRFLPIVMLTTENDSDRKQSAKRAGASAWLTKPFRPEQLLGLVRMVLPH